MQNKVQIFENRELGKVRVIIIDGQPWWVLQDVCKVLGLSNPTIVAGRLDEDEKLKIDPKSNLGSRSNTPVTIISESGLYAVILRSDKPIAKDFRKWITSDVLPTIRKHGAYIQKDVLEKMKNDGAFADELLRRLTQEQDKNKSLEIQIRQTAPKVRYYDFVLQNKDAIQVSIIAKEYGMSAIKFNRLLNELGLQFRKGKTWLLYQKYAGNGYTITKTYMAEGKIVSIHTCFTQHGRLFLYETLKEHGILPEAERTAES